ncbi:hypothetical protein EI77_04250 [Prosthecobacter fusiformis]|uniref:Uncharacterized protein n=1 Tax=Prosthecobacter fusiformis TaxID=48464 RepID=A0A4R7RK42_9BACT|nr:hypothetical protein [Prosthecobacter fusiformis]TDU64066.1 hypothetical protein EI77_04250 [Prosthecobacter fusiformis]
MAKPRKPSQDLLLPGATGWERWTGPAGGACTLVADYGPAAVGVFGKEAQTRLLALPLGHVWVLPAWLQGEVAHLRDMAALHLERLGVTVTDAAHGLQVRPLLAREGAHLVCMTALKEAHAPLWDTVRLPDEVLLSADCLPLPAHAMVIYRELGKLMLVITNGPEMVYASPLSAHVLDDHALGEVNHLCVQLGFQGVLGQVQNIVLWLEDEGDLEQVKRVTGLAAVREPRPAPVMPVAGRSTLVPPEILAARAQQAQSARTRLLVLTAGFAVAAAVAVMAVLIALATQERDLLRDRVAELTPQASQVMDQKRSWLEAAPAVDPTRFPMQVLLDCQVPGAAAEVSMTHFEWLPDRLLLRGRMPSPSLALQYAKEITEVEGLMPYAWETPAPVIASDNSATFELKGALKP